MSLTVALRLMFQGREAQAGVRSTATEVKGLTAATREAGAASTAAAGQQRQMTGALAETEAVTRRLSTAQATAAQSGRDLAQSNTLAAGSVGNLAANFNDIGVMIAAGQNPLQLAIQQGTQITQVIGPMGAAGAVGALKAAFLQMLNPLNLGTLAIIALGAAAVQWLSGAAEETMTLEDALEDLKSKVEAYQAASDKARSSTADLRKEFGQNAEAARKYYRELEAIERREAERAVRDTAATIRETVAPTSFFASDQKNAADLFGLSVWSRDSLRVINEVIGALDAVDRAKGIDNQVAALERLNAAMEAAAAADGQFTAAEDAALRNVNELLIAQAALRERIAQNAGQSAGGNVVDLAALVQMQNELAAARAEDMAIGQQLIAELSTEAQLRQMITQYGSDSAVVAAARANAERDVFAAMVDSMNVTSAMKEEMLRAYDAAKGIASVNIAGVLSAAVAQAGSLAGKLWDAANASSAIRPFANAAGKAVDGFKGWASGVWSNMVTMATSGQGSGTSGAGIPGSGAGRGSGGGGGGAARAEADAVSDLIARQERELEILRELDPVKKEMLRYSEQTTGATEAERQQLETLIATRQREESTIKARGDALRYANDMTMNLLNTIIVQGKSANAVAQQLLGTLLQAFVQGSGPLAGILGIKGGLWDMLPKRAGGGIINGAGTGTSDSILARVSDGEYIVNARATAHHRPLLEEINAGRLPAFAKGGMVGAAPTRTAQRTATLAERAQIHVHLAGASGDQQVREIAIAAVKEGLRQYDATVAPLSVRAATRDPRVAQR